MGGRTNVIFIYMEKKLTRSFYSKDAISVAKELLGKVLVRHFDDGTEIRTVITETEA